MRKLSLAAMVCGLLSFLFVVLSLAITQWASLGVGRYVGLWGTSQLVRDQWRIYSWSVLLGQCGDTEACLLANNAWFNAGNSAAAFMIIGLLPLVAAVALSAVRAFQSRGPYGEVAAKFVVLAFGASSACTALAWILWNSVRSYSTAQGPQPVANSFCLYGVVIGWLLSLLAALLAHADKFELRKGYAKLEGEASMPADWPVPPYSFNMAPFLLFRSWSAPGILRMLFYLSFPVAVVVYVLEITALFGSAVAFWRTLVLTLLYCIVGILGLRVVIEVLLVIFVWKDIQTHKYERVAHAGDVVDAIIEQAQPRGQEEQGDAPPSDQPQQGEYKEL